MPRRFPTPMLCGLVAAIGFSVGACSSGAQTPPLAQATAGQSAASPSSTSGHLHHGRPSVVVCPTDFPAPPPRRALYRPVRPPAGGVKDTVVYTDSRGELRLVGPRGWRCKAIFGQDLSGGLIIYPAGERLPVERRSPRLPTWPAGWHLDQNSKSEAISIVEAGLSDAQGAAQACWYFPAARTATLRDFGHGGCAPPSTERVRRVDRRRVEFEDPAGAPGGGIPSGGRYPSLGAVTYKASATPTGYQISCTIAKRISKICAADLHSSFEGSL